MTLHHVGTPRSSRCSWCPSRPPPGPSRGPRASSRQTPPASCPCTARAPAPWCHPPPGGTVPQAIRRPVRRAQTCGCKFSRLTSILGLGKINCRQVISGSLSNWRTCFFLPMPFAACLVDMHREFSFRFEASRSADFNLERLVVGEARLKIDIQSR